MSNNILILVDAGHLMTTPGKRTGILSNGQVMLERQFTKPVSEKMVVILQRCNFDTYLVAPNDYSNLSDKAELNERIAKANNYYAQWKAEHPNGKAFYISIHSNAGGGSGYEVWVHHEAVQSTVDMASLIVQSLQNETGYPIRSSNVKGKPAGVKFGYTGDINADYAVNRDTDMPSCLVEHLFMDNPAEAEQLAADSFRDKVAIANCKAICQYYGVQYVEEQNQSQTQTQPQPPTDDSTQADVEKLISTIKALNAALDMTIKTRDDLQVENSNLKSQYDQISVKYSNLLNELQAVINKYKQ